MGKTAPSDDRVAHTLDSYRLRHVAPIFNLIMDGVYHGSYSNLYLQPHYMAGLGIQLFCMLFFGRVRLPDGSWPVSEVRVLNVEGEFAGFYVLLHRRGSKVSELYMLSLEEKFRHKGLGETVLRYILRNLTNRGSLAVDCLWRSNEMMNLLRRLNFREITQGSEKSQLPFVRRFVHDNQGDTAVATALAEVGTP